MYLFFFLKSLPQLGHILRRNCDKIYLGYKEYDLDGIRGIGWESGLSNKVKSDKGGIREQLELRVNFEESKGIVMK